MTVPAPKFVTEPRTCFICGEPIAECMGAVLPRDAEKLLEGTWDKALRPRELCGRIPCGDAWNKMLTDEQVIQV